MQATHFAKHAVAKGVGTDMRHHCLTIQQARPCKFSLWSVVLFLSRLGIFFLLTDRIRPGTCDHDNRMALLTQYSDRCLLDAARKPGKAVERIKHAREYGGDVEFIK